MKLRKIWAFTLIELLVVISIISLLMGILMPSLNKAREQARRTACMSNLKAIGQTLYVYAQDNEDKLIPGNAWCEWHIWDRITEFPEGCEPLPGQTQDYQQVNLGYLLTSNKLPMPTGSNHVFFCHSSKYPNRKGYYEDFKEGWGSDDTPASASYMFNNALDGFDSYVQHGSLAILSHQNKINFLLGSGSVHTFDVKRLVFDQGEGLELLQEVAVRYGVCFPTIMLHKWLEIGEVDLDEAKEYLNNPVGWMADNCTLSSMKFPKDILFGNVSNRSLVCDVVGVMEQVEGYPEPSPPG